MNEDLLKNFSKTEIEDVIIAWKSDLTEFYFGGEYELTDIDWSYARSFFYAFQLCSTVGSKVVSKTTFSVYKLLTFFWMMYGLAFTGLLISSMKHLYQMHLLFSFECSCRKRKCKLKHYYVDVEKMDFHFMLIRAEAVRPGYTIWVIPKRVREGVCFKIYQTKKLSKLCEKIQMKIISILEDYILSSTEIFTAKSMKTLPKTIKQ